MATFIPEVQANLPEVKLYTPPFELISNFLDVKQEKYNAAALQIGGIRAQLAALPLTLEENIQRRDQFMNDADAQVKKLAEVDLSLPENYQAARDIFNPLLKDEDIMTDMTFTINQQALVAANQRFKNSSEEEDRKRYNPNNDAFVALKRQEFINSDPQRRKELAGQKSQFVNNVNIFEIAQDIAKENGLSIEWTSNPTTKGGGIPQVIFKGKNGEPVIGHAYNKLMGILGNNPYVKEYYNQLGYINVQSELQTLIPQMGYDAAVQQVAARYQMLDQSPGEDAQRLAEAESNKYVAASVVATAEDKISKSGVIPGSKQHLQYVESVNNLAGATEEVSNIVAKSYSTSIGQAQSLQDLYRIAGDLSFKVDLQNAAIDMAMSNSSRELIQNPLFLTSLKLRETRAKEYAAYNKDGGGSGGASGGMSYQERRAALQGGNTSVAETADGGSKIEAVIDILAKDADELLIGDQSLFAQAVEAYVAAGGKFQGVGGGNVATKVLTEINNLVEAGNRERALSRMSDYMEVMKTSIDNGVITGPAAVKYNELVQVKTELDNRYSEFRESLVDIIPAFIDQEAFRADGMFAGNPEVSEILNYLIDDNGAVRPKKEFREALQVAVNNGELSQVTVDWLSQGATFISADEIIRKKAAEILSEGIKNGTITQNGVRYDPVKDQISVLQRDGKYYPMNNSAFNTSTQSPTRIISQRALDDAKSYYERNPEELRELTGQRVSIKVNDIYDDMYFSFSRLYDQAGNYSPLNAGVTQVDNGSYAVERLSSSKLVSPTADAATKEGVEMLMLMAEGAAITNNAFMFPGTIQDNIVGIKTFGPQQKAKGAIVQDGEFTPAWTFWNSFQEDYGQEVANEKKDGSTSARGRLKTINNVDIGGERFTAIELTPEQDWIASNFTNTDGGAAGKLDGDIRSVTVLVPQSVASSQANLPNTADEVLYSSVLNEGYDMNIPNVADGAIRLNSKGQLEVDVYYSEFDPETGKYTRKPYPNNGPINNTLPTFVSYYDDVVNMINIVSAYNQAAIAEYNQQNGGVNDPDALKN